VSPIRVVFERGERSAVITVQNNGNTTMDYQIKIMRWEQDAHGKDIFTDTNDLIYFPKQLIVPPGEERVIRIGTKGGASPTEKNYRLFVAEVPPPQDSAARGQVAIALQFAVPIFVRPIVESASGELTSQILSKSNIEITLKNTGNVNFRVNVLTFTGKSDTGEQIFSEKVNGWYHLPGIARTYSAVVPFDICNRLKDIDLQIHTDRLDFAGKINVTPEMCKTQ
jgi:fimbrial chaperone protein